jgi:hypothetical protein
MRFEYPETEPAAINNWTHGLLVHIVAVSLQERL